MPIAAASTPGLAAQQQPLMLQLPQSVQARLEYMFTKGQVQVQDLEDCIFDSLRSSLF
jgi:hypothetical protein